MNNVRDLILWVYYWKHQVKKYRPKNGIAGRDQKFAMEICPEYKKSRQGLLNARARLNRYLRAQVAYWDRNGCPTEFYNEDAK